MMIFKCEVQISGIIYKDFFTYKLQHTTNYKSVMKFIKIFTRNIYKAAVEFRKYQLLIDNDSYLQYYRRYYLTLVTMVMESIRIFHVQFKDFL